MMPYYYFSLFPLITCEAVGFFPLAVCLSSVPYLCASSRFFIWGSADFQGFRADPAAGSCRARCRACLPGYSFFLVPGSQPLKDSLIPPFMLCTLCLYLFCCILSRTLMVLPPCLAPPSPGTVNTGAEPLLQVRPRPC